MREGAAASSGGEPEAGGDAADRQDGAAGGTQNGRGQGGASPYTTLSPDKVLKKRYELKRPIS